MVVAIETDGLLDVLVQPNTKEYPNQQVLVVGRDGYAYLVPMVEEKDYFFLKTITPSRKATREYLNAGVSKMKKLDAYEKDVLNACEAGKLKSIAPKSELARFKAVARSTAVRDKRVNIRLSSGDLSDI